MIMKFGSAAALMMMTTAAPTSPAPYTVVATASGPDGSFDYVSVDLPSGRVYVGRDFGVQVLSGGRLTTLTRRKGVAAVLPIGPHLMLSTNGDEDSATLFDRFTGQVVADIPTGKEPDGATYDAASGLAFVMNGGSDDVTVIDVSQRKPISRIVAGGGPEGAVTDGRGSLFLNIEDRNAVAVIAVAARKVVRRYPLRGCIEPTGIAYDAESGLLISACHNGVAKLTEAATGRDRGSVPIGKGADGSIFDPVRRLGFIPCLDGTLTIFHLDKSGKVTVVQRLTTREGARTAAYDTRHDRLYIASAHVERDAKSAYLRARTNFEILTVSRR